MQHVGDDKPGVISRMIVMAIGLIVVLIAVIGCLGIVGSSAKGYYENQSTREVVTAALRNPNLIKEISIGGVIFIILVMCHTAACLLWPDKLLSKQATPWPWVFAWFYAIFAGPIVAHITLPAAPFIMADLLSGNNMDGESWDDGGVLWLSGQIWILLSTVMLIRATVFRIQFIWKNPKLN